MSRGLLSFLGIWTLGGVVLVQAAVGVSDVTDSPLLSEGGQETAGVMMWLSGHFVLLVSCLWIARVERELRDRGKRRYIKRVRQAQAFVAGLYLMLFLFLTTVVVGIGSLVTESDSLDSLILGPAADEAALEASYLMIMSLTTGVAFFAAFVSAPAFLFAVLTGSRQRGGSVGSTGMLKGGVDDFSAILWPAIPLLAETGLIVVDAIQVMSSHGIEPLTVIAIVLMPLAGLPALRERLGSP